MHRARLFSAAAASALLSLIAACGAEPASEPAGDGEAAVEVLEGTISDEMIPLDRLRSQAPPAPVQPGEAPLAPAPPPGAPAAATGEGEGQEAPVDEAGEDSAPEPAEG